MTELKACPFCGPGDIETNGTHTCCYGCGANTLDCDWNIRPAEDRKDELLREAKMFIGELLDMGHGNDAMRDLFARLEKEAGDE